MKINDFKENNENKKEVMEKKMEALKLENINSMWYFIVATLKAVVIKLLKKKFEAQKIMGLYDLLKLNKVSKNLQIKKMSDGQKQKIKLLAFLSADPKVIILDEFTNALDKNSSIDLYEFLMPV